ncbi:carbohydrate ABC transporter permease [Carnobacterium gallinarum]|uniref:carbohydrate ABC transporter permease n=1 Tax=Carnobacterium gallinarum TaxID=2749 RepID=UPI00054EB165|nr:carbohydrate ABC transporter permease [Carnobacterium gallinarum]
MTKKITGKKIGLYAFLMILALITFFPFYIMIVNATRSTGDIMSGFSLIPSTFLAENFKDMQARVDAVAAFKNSLIIATLSTALTCYFSSLTAYAFVAYDFKYKNALFGAVLVIMMIPSQLSIIGFYKFVKNMNLLNSYVPLIVPAIASAATVFFIKQYTESALSRSIIESARIDGASEFGIFNRIALPIMSPAIFTMGITSFVGSWNNYLTPLILLSDPKKYTLPLIIRIINSDVQDPSVGAMYLSIAISIVPIMVVFFMFSRYIIDGVGSGGEKE